MTSEPILYSFRRCPYAMRARMALLVSKTPVRLREVVLRDKPDEMVAASAKATVPVLVLNDNSVIDQSLDIMLWALQRNDPNGWLIGQESGDALVSECESDFKYHLDRYKYPNRYENVDPLDHRAKGLQFLIKLDDIIALRGQISGKNSSFSDHAIFPFVRQFANTDRNWFDAQNLPALMPWLQDHLSSDLFGIIMTKYPQWRAGDEEPRFGNTDIEGQILD